MFYSAKACAKINLGLHITSRRPDGFHEIESAMILTGWHDRVTVRSSSSFSFTCSIEGLTTTPDENLCVAAYRILKEAAPERPDLEAHIHLEKNVPWGAGLGGGSSDAAWTLTLLNQLWDLRLDQEKLQQLASTLGSDVPFFLANGPQLATGRGEVLSPLRLGADAEWHLVIVKPDFSISTAQAYAGVVPNATGRESIREVLALDVPDWRGRLVNDFEPSVFALHPDLADTKAAMYESGASYASLSGSGSALYAIGEEKIVAGLDREFRSSGMTTWRGLLIPNESG